MDTNDWCIILKYIGRNILISYSGVNWGENPHIFF